MSTSTSQQRSGKCYIVIPLANEGNSMPYLFSRLDAVLAGLTNCHVLLICDYASKDATYLQCEEKASMDANYHSLFAHNSKSVVDAYLFGFAAALALGADCVLEMDGGLSHQPEEIPQFIRAWEQGFDAVFSTRAPSAGGASQGAGTYRKFLSKGGTIAANLLLGTALSDMTSGFEAFDRKVVEQIVCYPLKSKAHFFQTEIRYLCRNLRWCEVPILYKNPSSGPNLKALSNACAAFLYYVFKRFTFQSRSF